MTRKEFLIVVAQRSGRKPATVAQYIYMAKFQPAAFKQEGHLRRPDFSMNQVQAAVDLVLRKNEEPETADAEV